MQVDMEPIDWQAIIAIEFIEFSTLFFLILRITHDCFDIPQESIPHYLKVKSFLELEL